MKAERAGQSKGDMAARLRLRRPSVAAIVTVVVTAGAAVFVLLQMQPRLLVADTLPAGGDMGAHVWGPAYMRDHLLPHGRISGWTHDWYLGFPAYHFYFPLPSLLIVVLDAIPGIAYGVAFKLVTVLGLVSLPASAAVLGRALRLPFPAPPLFALAAVPFVFDRYHTIWGGNAAATLAGEFSFSIALSLALLFLAALSAALDTGKHRALAAALFAATALCHLIPAAFAVGAAIILLLTRRPDGPRWRLVITVGVLGAALTAFWLVPFLARMPFSNDMGWERTFEYIKNLFPFLRTDTSAPAVSTRHLKVVVPMAGLGALLTIIRMRRGGIALLLMAAGTAAAFRYIPPGPIWNARVLPFWYLLLYLLAAVAIVEISVLLADAFRLPNGEPGHMLPIAATAAAALTVFGVIGAPLGAVPRWTGVTTEAKSFVPDWARWNYSGYERKPAYTEFKDVIDTMRDLGQANGCGRAMWEYEPELDRYGTPMALMLLPHFTDGCIGSMEGLYFESSATVPFHFLNQSELSKTPSRAMRDLPYRNLDITAGVEHLELLGVRYYMATSPEAQAAANANPDLEFLAATGVYPVTYTSGVQPRNWHIYEVEGAELVRPLNYEPVVVEDGAEGKEGWLDAAVDWYQDPARWDTPLAVDGPDEWERIPSPHAAIAPHEVRAAEVSRIRVDDDRISFDVDRPGTPVVINASYFPNWKASGASGPWRVTPNLMVVIPTERHVELRYGWTAVDVAGWFITLLGLVGLVLLVRRGAVDLPQPPEIPEDVVSGDLSDLDDPVEREELQDAFARAP